MNDMNTVSNSKFHMFRCLIVMAHADNVFSEEERAYMNSMIERQPFSDEQKTTLEDDMDNPKNLEDLLPAVTEPEFRGQIVYFARLMAYKDGIFDPSEEELLERLHANAMRNVNIGELREDVRRAIALNLKEREAEIEELRPKSGLYAAFDKLLRSIGIDLYR